MTSQTRDRSPGAPKYISNSASASPHPPLDSAFSPPDPSLSHGQYNGLGLQNNINTSNDPAFSQADPNNYYLGSGYDALPQAPVLPSQGNNISNHTFLQSSGLANHTTSAGDSTSFPSFDFSQQSYDASNAALDPTILNDISTNPLDLQDNATSMAAMQSHSPTPPHLLPDMARRSSNNSPSPSASPSYATFGGANRPRNTSESLDPSSALFPQGQNEWTSMGAYRTHRRTPSDQYSDYSSHSNQASPYMPTLDNFDGHSSPLLNSQDPTFNDGLGLQQFSLNDNSAQQQIQNHYSPGQSPHISPRLMPQTQQALPQFTSDNNFGMNADMGGQFGQSNGMDMFPGTGQEPFPSLNNGLEIGNADQMSPPTIEVNYAPPTLPVDNGRLNTDGEALSPPVRSKWTPEHHFTYNTDSCMTDQSRNRMRAKSDSYAGSRSPSPSISRGRSPSLQPTTSGASVENLSPFDHDSASRSPSPSSRGRNGSLGRGRSSSNASDQRDYILNLAEPERTPSNGAKEGRVQKHPATFQCTLCPKRFTRAYNLRSHLRTHTDERPFVCTVCGKAFARQHDRKRHEGLHSGEKKFVCKGNLQSGSQWGCGRRFARADALGRHFRSEAGRVCIKPLLDEEAAERQKAWIEEQQQAQVAAGLVAPQPLMHQPQQFDMSGTFLPAALLQQYPALAGIDWNSIPQGNPAPEEDYSGRSSFDASSGGEYYDDMSENEMGSYPDPSMGGMSMNMSGMGMQHGNSQQFGSHAYGGGTGDYLSDFEGR